MKAVSEQSAPTSSTPLQEPQFKKNFISLVLFLALAALTFYTIFHGNDMRQVVLAMEGLNPIYLFLCGGCALLFVCGEGFMIWYLLHKLHPGTRLLSCIRYSFIGFFYSGITPSATGGQPMQLYYMKKEGQKLSESTVVLMTVAILYKFVLVLIGVGLLIFAKDMLDQALSTYYYWLYYIGLALNVILVAVLLFVMFRPQLFRSVLSGGEKILVKLHILKPSDKRQDLVIEFVDSYQNTLDFLKQNKYRIVVVTFLTVLQRSTLFVLTWFVYQGLGLTGENGATVIGLQAAVYIAVDMLPLPGAQGISELMYKHIFAGVFTGSYLTASMCISRGFNFYFLLIISAGFALYAWFTGKKQMKSIK